MTKKEFSQLTIENPHRSKEKVRRLTQEDLGIPSGGQEVEQDDWDRLYDLSYQAATESEVGVAVRTIDGNIAKGINLSHGTSTSVHAIELAIWKAFSENYTPIVQIAIYSENDDFDPCGRCRQVILDYTANPEIRTRLGSEQEWSKVEYSDNDSRDSKSEDGTESNDEDSLKGEDGENDDISDEGVDTTYTPDPDGDKLEIEYVRFDSPVYHLRYKQLNRTFCGRQLHDGEYQSGNSEPELLDPCRSCHGEGPKTLEQQKEDLRAELYDFISGVGMPDDNPGQFQRDELVALIESLEEETLTNELIEKDLRFRLSRMLRGVSYDAEEPLSFAKAELEAIVRGIRGDEVISSEPHLFIWTDNDLIQRVPLDSFPIQRRGGKGKDVLGSGKGSRAKNFFVTSPRDVVLIFTNLGKVYRMDGYEVPISKTDRVGDYVSSIIDLDGDESVEAAVTLQKLEDYDYIAFLSNTGRVKRTQTKRFEHILSTGIIAMELGDSELADVALANNGMDILIGSQNGNVIRFEDSDVSEVNRRTRGVQGIELKKGDYAASLTVVSPDERKYILTATKFGYGKRTPLVEYRSQKRNGTGLVDIKTKERNGPVVDLESTTNTDELLILSKFGRVLRTSIDEVAEVHRNTKGVLLMHLEDGDSLAAIDVVDMAGY